MYIRQTKIRQRLQGRDQIKAFRDFFVCKSDETQALFGQGDVWVIQICTGTEVMLPGCQYNFYLWTK